MTNQSKSNAEKTDLPTLQEPTASQNSRDETALKRAPRLKLSKNGFSIDHPDPQVGEQLIMQALGTTDRNFTYGTLKQLANAASSQGRPPDETDLNYMLSIVIGIKPRDQLEAMLATQIAAVHVSSMRFANYLANTDNIYQQDSGERVFSKLTRTFLAQMEALKRYRSSDEQNVTIQNVSVKEGGQAIVGNVTQQPAPAPAITDARTTSMKILGDHEPEPFPARRKSNT